MGQMTQGVTYCHSLFYATQPAEELAAFLVDSTSGKMARVFISSSGSEAVEAALKMARQYHVEKESPEPERVYFIGRQQSYHGTTLGALGAGGHKARRAIYEPMLSPNSRFVSPCFAYRYKRAGETDRQYVDRLEAELDAQFRDLGPRKVAAFIAEPIVGAALGCVPSVPGYFKAARRVCDKYGALLIMDEVMCGVGRCGPRPSDRFPEPLHAWQDDSVGVAPDIMTMGKALGGGFQPIAAMMANHKVIDALAGRTGAFAHGQTYQAHPLCCRAALEVQRIIQEQQLVANVRRQGQLLGSLLTEALRDHPHVGDIRGQGLFWGIEFVRDKARKTPFEYSKAIAMGIHELGTWIARPAWQPDTCAKTLTGMQAPFNISLYPGNGTVDGVNGDHIILAPAFNVTTDDIHFIAKTTAAVIDKFFQDKCSPSISFTRRPRKTSAA